SRRRHTRSKRDWSSDVCSSDLQTYEGGISRLYMFDPLTEEKEWVANLPDGVIDSLSWLNQDQLIFTLKTPTKPGDVWCLTLSTEIGRASCRERMQIGLGAGAG